MKILDLLKEETPNIPEHLKTQFTNVFNRIQSQIKNETDVNISHKWLAGLMNQFQDFKRWDRLYDYYKKEGKGDPRDLKARIIARDILTNLGLFDKTNNYIPLKRPLLSAMRQFYSYDTQEQKDAEDLGKSTRMAAGQEFQEWIAQLPKLQRVFVTNLHELTSQELAAFRGVLEAKENKKGFAIKLYNFAKNNEAGFKAFQNMGIISQDEKFSLKRIEQLRGFLNDLSSARLHDVLSKEAVYSAKSQIHTTHRAANKVLKDLEYNQGGFRTILNLYHNLSKRVEGYQDSEREFRRLLNRVPGAVEDSKLTMLGRGAYTLFRKFKGKELDPMVALQNLNNLYHNPAGREHRAEKAEGRGNSIRKTAEI